MGSLPVPSEAKEEVLQMSSNLIRRGGLAAMVGGILGLLHSPFYAVAYFATESGAESLDAP